MATKDAALNGASNSFNPSLYSLFTYADAPGLVHPLPITREWKTPDFTLPPTHQVMTSITARCEPTAKN